MLLCIEVERTHTTGPVISAEIREGGPKSGNKAESPTGSGPSPCEGKKKIPPIDILIHTPLSHSCERDPNHVGRLNLSNRFQSSAAARTQWLGR